MTGDAVIREARPDDLPAIRTIQGTTLTDPTPALLEPAVAGPLTTLVRSTGEGDVLGYVIAVTGDERAYLPELAVASDVQGGGHGSALLGEISERLCTAGVQTLRVTARAGDRRARDFYANRGFEAVDRVPDHYGEEDGVVYERECCV